MGGTSKRFVLAGIAAIGIVLGSLSAAPAQSEKDSYPSRAVTILAPFTAGGVADQATRVLAEFLEKQNRVPFRVENVPGAGGVVAAKRLGNEAADGYTWFSASSGLLTIMPNLPDAEIKPLEEFDMLGVIRTQPLLVVVRNDSPYRTLQDLVDEARKRPDEITYASIGVNSLLHLAGELLNEQAEIKLVHVPYPGAAQYVVDLLAGRVDLAITTPGTLASHRGELRALVQSTTTRSRFVPDVPTSIEAGLPGFQFESWTAMVVKKGTPQALREKMTEMLKTVYEDPDYKKRFDNMDVEPIFISGADYQESYFAQIKARAATMKAFGAQ